MREISVIICTYNHADSRATLTSLKQVEMPECCRVEVLVGDNGSQDDTAAVVRAADLAPLGLRYLHERRKGKVDRAQCGAVRRFRRDNGLC